MYSRKKINFRFAAILLGIVVVSGTTTHFLHAYQVKRGSREMLAEAIRFQEAGETEQAADYLERYLRLNPSDTDARSRHALLINSLAKSGRHKQQAYELLNEALSHDPSRHELRRELIPLAIFLGEYKEARRDIAELQALGLEDCELMRQQARVEVAERKFDNAEKWYRKAIAADPTKFEISLELASLFRGPLNSATFADLAVDQMVKSAGERVLVRLAAANYYRRWGNHEKAYASITNSVGVPCSDDAEVLLLAADVANVRGKREDSRRLLNRGIELYPNDSRFQCSLVPMELQEGQREQALKLVETLARDASIPPEQLWQLGNLMIELGETTRLEELLGRLVKKAPRWTTDYLRGLLLFRQESWAEARKMFEETLLEAKNPPLELVRQAHLLSADCYARLGNPDGQLNECRKAQAIDPGWLPASERLASAFTSLGKTDDAIREYRLIASQSANSRVELARLLFNRTIRMPANERKWAEIDGLINNLPEPQRLAGQQILIESLAVQGKLNEAKKLAESERDRDPKLPGPWLNLIGLATDARAATAILEEAEKKAGPRAEWLIARVRIAARAGGDSLNGTLTALASEAGNLSASERDRVLLAIGEARINAGDLAGAATVWGRVAESRPNDADIRLRLFGLAMQRSEFATARELKNALAVLEGPNGPLASFAEASLLAVNARKGDRAALTAARSAVSKALTMRPSWTALVILEAELFEFAGEKTKAIERYQSLVDSGRASVDVARRLVQLLAAEGKFNEARSVIARLPEQAAEAAQFEKAAAQLSLLAAGDLQGKQAVDARKKGLDESRKAIKPDSKDYREFHWLGEMALLAGEVAEAERAFRKALELKTDAPEVWISLVVMLSRQDLKKAEAELELARSKLSKEHAPMVLATCYEAIGKPREAAAEHQAIAAARPGDALGLRNLAGFLVRTGDMAKAEPLLRQLLAPGSKATPEILHWARRALALVLSSQGGFDRNREASALIEENLALPLAGAEDRLTKALVLAGQPGRRREAIELLEKVTIPASAPPAARFALARLYDQDGRWEPARAEMVNLLRVHDKNPAYLGYFAAALIRHGQPAAAEPWVKQLESVSGESLGTIELRARIFLANKKHAETVKLINEFVTKRGKEATLGGAILFDSLNLPAEAEPLYRTFAREAKESTAPLALAGFLARQHRLKEAFDIYEPLWKTCPPEAVARGAVASLRVGKFAASDARRVEQWLDTALAVHPQSIGLLLLKADLKQLREQFDEAASIYRGILARDVRNVIALNNLAFLISMRDSKDEESIRLIDAGLAITGPHPELLDTRGTILTRSGRTDEALADLQRSISDSPSPVKQFHLALALAKANRKAAASDARQDAETAGLKPEELHPLERPEWEYLSQEFPKR